MTQSRRELFQQAANRFGSLNDVAKQADQLTQSLEALPTVFASILSSRSDAMAEAANGDPLNAKHMIETAQAAQRSFAALDRALKHVAPLLAKVERQAAKDAAKLRTAEAASTGSAKPSDRDPVVVKHHAAVAKAIQTVQFPLDDFGNLLERLQRTPYSREVPELKKLLDQLDDKIDRLTELLRGMRGQLQSLDARVF